MADNPYERTNREKKVQTFVAFLRADDITAEVASRFNVREWESYAISAGVGYPGEESKRSIIAELGKPELSMRSIHTRISQSATGDGFDLVIDYPLPLVFQNITMGELLQRCACAVEIAAESVARSAAKKEEACTHQR